MAMAWVFLALTVGSAVMAGKILLAFTGYLLVVEPLISELHQQTLDLDLAAEVEADQRTKIRERLVELRDSLLLERRKRDQLQQMLEAERIQETRLALALQKQNLRQDR